MHYIVISTTFLKVNQHKEPSQNKKNPDQHTNWIRVLNNINEGVNIKTIYISYLADIHHSTPEQRSLEKVITAIRSCEYAEKINQIKNEKDEKRQSALKRKLSAFSPSLEMVAKKGLADDSIPTGLVQMELDLKDNPDADIALIQQTITSLPEIAYCFLSPRGGLKFAIRTDFTKLENEGMSSLKSRFKQAYELCKQYILSKTSINFDDSLSSISQLCFVSYDENAYFNQDCIVLTVNNKCIYKEDVYLAESCDSFTTPDQIEELLKYIPQGLSWDDRRPINFAVLNSMGSSGVGVLLGHWITDGRAKLERDLHSQLRSSKYGGIGTLVNEAKKYGYKAANGRAISKLRATPINYRFTPFLSPEEADNKLHKSIETFFNADKSMFINISTGLGKTTAALKILKMLPWGKTILFLVPSHKLANEIIKKYEKTPVPEADKSLTTFERMKFNLPRKFCGITHMKGRDLMCQNHEVLLKHQEAGISIPVEYCQSECGVYSYTECPYIEQFNDHRSNIRVMTHSEFIGEQSAWFYGNESTSGSPPMKGNKKPDYIVVDENWLERDDHIASLESEFDSIRNIINQVINGIDLPDAICNFEDEVFSDWFDMQNIYHPTFKNLNQYIDDCKKKNKRLADSEMLEAFHNFVISGDADEISKMKLHNKKLHYLKMNRVADRYKGVPTLFLDATADKGIVKKLIGDIDFRSIKVKANSDINVYQAENFNITKTWLSKEKNKEQLVRFLIGCNKKYKKVGLITYKKIDAQADFDKWLARETGTELFGHFGDVRGRDEFEEADCLLIIGRHLIPQHEIQNYGQAIFGELMSLGQNLLDVPIRMKDGSSMAIKNNIYDDNRLEMIRKCFCPSETIQAIGRGRLIWGKKKDIFLLTKESMGEDVEITKLIRSEELFDNQKYVHAIKTLKKIGFCKNKTSDLKALGLTISNVNKKRGEIDEAFIEAGFERLNVTFKDKHRNVKTNEYYVYCRDSIEKIGGTIG